MTTLSLWYKRRRKNQGKNKMSIVEVNDKIDDLAAEVVDLKTDLEEANKTIRILIRLLADKMLEVEELPDSE